MEAAIRSVASQPPPAVRAIKVIHRPDAQARARFEAEVETLNRIKDPGLIPILDSNTEGRWFVTERYRKTLAEAIKAGRQQPVEALSRIRPIVAAVARLHANRVVHRDIKPDNIFVRPDGSLVLGDFGLATDLDDEETRLTGTLERVGSRDWMPMWAQHGRLEQVTPAFDVFCLAKVVWAMLTGQPRLPFRYSYTPALTLSHFIEDKQQVRRLEPLLAACITEYDKDCLRDAAAFLSQLDSALGGLTANYQKVTAKDRRCLVCGEGAYRRIVAPDGPNTLANIGLNPGSNNRYSVFACVNCGHVQFFFFEGGTPPPAWA